MTPHNAWISPRQAERQFYSKQEKSEAKEQFTSATAIGDLVWLTAHCTEGYR